MLKIEFEYHDNYCRDAKWNKQSCVCSSVAECIKFYGLNEPDCEYRIVSVTEV